MNKFLKAEGVLVVISPGNGPDGGTIMGSAAGSATTKDEDMPPPSVIVTNEHYNRIARLLEKQIPVTLEFDLGAKFSDAGDSFNITAEIPGTDPNAGFVMLGGHFDSWTGGTGATDNGAGSAVAMEAMRILKALDVRMPRTVRLGLWTAEEQGLLGSRAYVQKHRDEMPRISAAIVHDTGTGKVTGIDARHRPILQPLLAKELVSLKDLGVATFDSAFIGGSDHASFDRAGPPGLMFRQEVAGYRLNHHSQADTLDRAQEPDLIQGAQVMAVAAMRIANLDELLTREKK